MEPIAIYIPAYNAALTLESVINRIPEEVWNALVCMWIINDGSTDNTAEVINKIAAQDTRVNAVHFKSNAGYGAAVKAGFIACKESNASFIVCLHSDGQYPPEYIPQMVGACAADKNIGLVQGSRLREQGALEGGMPLYKFVAGKALVALENRLFSLSQTDFHSGFLCYSKAFADSVDVRRLSGGFEIDLELIICAKQNGFRVAEIAIPTRYAGEISHLNPFGYGFRVVFVMIKFMFNSYKKLPKRLI